MVVRWATKGACSRFTSTVEMDVIKLKKMMSESATTSNGQSQNLKHRDDEKNSPHKSYKCKGMSVGQTSRHTRGSHQCRLNWNGKHQDIQSLLREALTLLAKRNRSQYHVQSHSHSFFVLLLVLQLPLLTLS